MSIFMRYFNILFSVCLLHFAQFVFAQGCSDAGVCSIYHTETDSSEMAVHQFRQGIQYSLGERFVHQFTWTTELSLALSPKGRLTGRMPLSTTLGNIGDYTGPGDLTLLYSHTEMNEKGARLSLTAGSRVPLSNAGAAGLPMPFQPGLGTWDAMFAVEGEYKDFALQLGYQHVLQHYNANSYLPPGQPEDHRGDGFFASRNLRRGNDFLLRTQYTLRKEKWIFIPGAMLVWRLQPDTYQNAENTTVVLDQSQGPTVNIVLRSQIPVHENHSLDILLAGPVFARKQRPDGLTRLLVLGIGWTLQLPGRKFLMG
jgi:hypothetical protein